MNMAEKLSHLKIFLPPPPKPLAAYVPTVLTGNLLFVAGQGPIIDGKPVITGKLGDTVSVAEGVDAAKLSVLNSLSAIVGAIGDLDKITRIVKLNGYVNSTSDFSSQHLVINGASELLADIFGERGRHARAAVGTNTLPLNIPVEIELIVELSQ